MFTGKPPKKPILKHTTAPLGVSTKKVSFGSSQDNSPGLSKFKALRANIEQDFIQDQEEFENLKTTIEEIKWQQASIKKQDELEESLSEIDFLQKNLSGYEPEHNQYLRSVEIPEENKENDPQNIVTNQSYAGSQQKEKSRISGNNSQLKKAEQEGQGNISMELSNSSHLSLPKLLDQSIRSGAQSPVKEGQEEQEPQILVTTPSGGKKTLREGMDASIVREDIMDHHSPVSKHSLSRLNEAEGRIDHLQEATQENLKLSVPESNIQIDRPNMEALLGSGETNRYYYLTVEQGEQERARSRLVEDFEEGKEEKEKSRLENSIMKESKLLSGKEADLLRESSPKKKTVPKSEVLDMVSKRLEQDMKAWNPNKSMNMAPNEELEMDLERLKNLKFMKESKLLSEKSFKESFIDHEGISEIHHDERENEILATAKSDLFKDFNFEKKTVPRSEVLDLVSKRLEQDVKGWNPNKSMNMAPNDELEMNLERLKSLKFDLFKKTDKLLSNLKEQSLLDKSREMTVQQEGELNESVKQQEASQVENAVKEEEDEDTLAAKVREQILEKMRQFELKVAEEKEREELARQEEKRIAREAAVSKLAAKLGEIINLVEQIDVENTFRDLKEEFYDKFEREKLEKIEQGLIKLDEGVFSSQKELAYGFNELREHLKDILVTQNAQEFRDNMLVYKGLIALRDYEKKIKKKLLFEAKAKEHLRRNRLRNCFTEIQKHANFCREWLLNVKLEMTTLKKLQVFEAWRVTAREEKVERLTDEHLYWKEMKLKGEVFKRWQQETIQDYRIPLEIGRKKTKKKLVRNGFRALKFYLNKRRISKENNMKAYTHLMDTLSSKYFKALVPYYMRVQNRKVNVDEFDEYIPLRISIKDKVTKISGKEKDWALLNNEKSVVIDVVRNKGRR